MSHRTLKKRTLPVRNRVFKGLSLLLITGGLATLLATGPLQPHVAAFQTSKGVYIPENHYQFSAQELARKNATLIHTFTLYNGHAQPLHITASADCGCTSTSWEEATIAPFGQKEITATMDNNGHSNIVMLTFKAGGNDYVFASLKN